LCALADWRQQRGEAEQAEELLQMALQTCVCGVCVWGDVVRSVSTLFSGTADGDCLSREARKLENARDFVNADRLYRESLVSCVMRAFGW
jgi:hypothetical protein